MNWLEITISTNHSEIESLEDKLIALDTEGFVIEDSEDIETFLKNNRRYWDYIDEKFLSDMRDVCRVKFYLHDSPEGRRELERYVEALPEYELICRNVKDEDWENNWKKYYKPVMVGQRLLIVPEWESVPENTGRKILRLNPGLIFGTGYHATTKMCLKEIDYLSKSGADVLDLGCGSGILSIAALILGCWNAAACDVDPKAPDIVRANAKLNGIRNTHRLKAFCGDVTDAELLRRELGTVKFDIVVSNIVADVIIKLAEIVPEFIKPDGTYICSGIIDGRESEVESALNKNGFSIIKHDKEDNWHAYVCGRSDYNV